MTVRSHRYKLIVTCMQITILKVCDTSKVSLYKQINPPLMGEHAFPLTGFVCKLVHITFDGSVGDKVNCQTGVVLPM